VIIFFIVNIFCNHVSISHMVLGITRLMVNGTIVLHIE